jgi:peptidoglycan hydrolase CwlO-like protein
MRSTLIIVALLSTLTVSGSAVADAQSISDTVTAVHGAPIGHLQPRAQQFSPRAPAEQAEQQQMSTFDAQQQKLDEELDKQLNICRGC